MEYDVFISHASEDKADVARPLAAHLQKLGLRVWLDEFELTLGDSLRRKIDHGLSKSKYGLVILSPAFFSKSHSWGHPLKGTCQEKKVVRKQEEAFFLRRRCGCENGLFYSSSEQPPPYRLFCSRSNLLPTLHGSLRFSLTER